MLKRFQSAFFILICILIPGTGEGFVPQAPHLLHLVIEKIRKPVGIEAYQTKKVLNYEDVTKGFNTIEEKLIYVFPGRLRSQMISDIATGFSIETESGFIKVMGERIIATAKSSIDLYTDILLYRDHESMLAQLDHAGIDTQNVSFHRYNNKICYVIGTPDAGLWIEKDSFFPIKYVIQKSGWKVEFFYDDWRKVSRTWYPMAGSIFLDDQLVATINVKYFELKAQVSGSMFDLDHVKSIYPENKLDVADPDESQVDELDRSIEDFKKLYE